MDITLTPDDWKRLGIFFPYALGKTLAALTDSTRFVHYSSADAALAMVTQGEVWMRKARAMNDFRELEYGRQCILTAYGSPAGAKLKTLLNGVFPGFSEELERLFDGWSPHLWEDTYLTCISEHESAEDRIGRLSMWRAYGGRAGVAVVLNGGVFLRPSDALKAYSSPVAYLWEDEFVAAFAAVADRIESEVEFVRSQGMQLILNTVFQMLRSAMVCTKHPGFREEREWRIIYTPRFDKSPRIAHDVVSINGVPQPVQKIPLKNVPEEGLYGIEIPELVERVIIGPTNFPLEIREALISRLKDKGVTDAEGKVIVSSIPLRNV